VLKTQAQREARAKFNERILPRNGGK
jgi:hypothetical protein